MPYCNYCDKQLNTCYTKTAYGFKCNGVCSGQKPKIINLKINCCRCEIKIIRDSKEHNECHINTYDDIICKHCLEHCDCELCEEEVIE